MDIAIENKITKSSKSRKQLYLDPRTKICMVLTVSTIMLVGNQVGGMIYLQRFLTILPLIGLLMMKKRKTALKYAGMYLFCWIVPEVIMPYLPILLNLLFTGMIALGIKILPGMLMVYFLITSTTVSEFIAAMERMHIPKKLLIPVSVMFRFLPTIKEEYKAIQDAMRLREVGSLRNPIAMLEYRLVPLLMSIVAIGNDLAASALTRGLGAPVVRVNRCDIGFRWTDALAFIGMIIAWGTFIALML